MRGLRLQRTEIRTDRDVAEACHAVRDMAAVARFAERDATAAATIVAELTRNVLRYAGEGECSLRLDFLDRRSQLSIVCRDSGPGIADVSSALEDGYSTGSGLGIGLPGVRRLADSFSLETGAQGTRVEATLVRPQVAPRPSVARSAGPGPTARR